MGDPAGKRELGDAQLRGKRVLCHDRVEDWLPWGAPEALPQINVSSRVPALSAQVSRPRHREESGPRISQDWLRAPSVGTPRSRRSGGCLPGIS